MSIEYQHSILWRGEDPTKFKFKPARDETKRTTRYFPGKAPKWAREDAPDDSENEKERKEESRRQRRRQPASEARIDVANSRLQRLQASASEGVGLAERMLRHRIIHEARVLEAADEKDAKKEDVSSDEQEAFKVEIKEEDDLDIDRPLAQLESPLGQQDAEENLRQSQRQRARECALRKRREEEEALSRAEAVDEGADKEHEGESEYETESEEEDLGMQAMLKPVFVPRSHRETIREKELLEQEEEEALERQKERFKERKVESKNMLVEEIRLAEEAERDGADMNDASDIELVDDDDEKNEAEEYELWKIRELKRIKRDKEERMARQSEMEWIEKRRSMTDAERMADDAELDQKVKRRDEVKQFNFLQKYYHRGGFFQDRARTGDEPLYLRDYHEPLEAEKFDKQMLPKAMQLRRGQFGKKGQVKHSHLTEVDTTDMSAAWSQNTKPIQRYQAKMAAASGVNEFDRPSRSSAA